ncbi:MAG TPA: glycoside hydrolase family 3 protein [candidate division Zixibacteria bacterium]|nr:glycoside hydrolase family 3 protein [candidate division Zixibacteria bacterium]
MGALEKIAQQAVFGFEGISPSRAFADFVERAQPAGIILFERNLSTLAKLKTIIKSLKDLSPKTLFMIDEEGGEKSRLRVEHGFPNPPNSRDIPHMMSAGDACEAYRIAGDALSELGIDVDLAPVADIAPIGHILGKRAFSDEADICAEYVTATVEGLKQGGVKTCAKHFPGLGSADIDPHLGVSVAREGEDFQCHFKPFVAAIRAGVDYIMTTHLRAKSLDFSGKIATFSPIIVQILRDELEFQGKIITDDLFMAGASTNLGIADRALKALRSGHDMALICSELSPSEYSA